MIYSNKRSSDLIETEMFTCNTFKCAVSDCTLKVTEGTRNAGFTLEVLVHARSVNSALRSCTLEVRN
jgi:hypothetical protein